MDKNYIKLFLKEPLLYIKNMKTYFFNVLDGIQYKKKCKSLYKRILSDCNQLENEEYREYISTIKKRGYITMFNSNFEDFYSEDDIFISESGMKYVMWNGKKLFFYFGISDSRLRRTVRDLKIEQDYRSPHKYLHEDESLIGYHFFDCGSAEASFSLDIIEGLEHLYLFEADKKWTPVLANTFKDWENKTTIVSKYVGVKDNENTLDFGKFIEKLAQNGRLDLEKDKIFIKMDIEGCEEKVLESLVPVLKKAKNVKLAVCAYHKNDAEQNIRKIIPKEYRVVPQNGYMLVANMDEQIYPYFRRGVLRIERM